MEVLCLFGSLVLLRVAQQHFPFLPPKPLEPVAKKKSKPNKEKRKQKRAEKGALTLDGPVVESFKKILKNKTVVLTNLISQGREIENRWESEEEKLNLLTEFRKCLYLLGNHKDKDLNDLSSLGEKMKNVHKGNLENFMLLFLPIERKYSKGLQDCDIVIMEKDLPLPQQTLPIKVGVILDNLRSSFNVGSIFRTSDCIGVSHVYLCGYTATPSEDNKDLVKTTMGTHESIPWSYHKNIHDLVKELKASGNTIIALETVKDSKSLFERDFLTLQKGVCIILGNERCGISENLLKECDQIISIPCIGRKNSLNVGVSFGVIGYELFRQIQSHTV